MYISILLILIGIHTINYSLKRLTDDSKNSFLFFFWNWIQNLDDYFFDDHLLNRKTFLWVIILYIQWDRRLVVVYSWNILDNEINLKPKGLIYRSRLLNCEFKKKWICSLINFCKIWRPYKGTLLIEVATNVQWTALYSMIVLNGGYYWCVILYYIK